MPKSAILFLQVRNHYNTACLRTENGFLLVLPCPATCVASIIDCWSMVLMLLTSGDIEENPGPSTAQMLEKKILENQAASDAKLDAMQQDISDLTAQSDILAGCLEVIEEMSK